MQIIVIGTGNVGFHLCKRMKEVGLGLGQIVGRKDIPTLATTADVYILAVSDAAIVEVAAQITPFLPSSALVLHTSGTTSGEVLAPFFKNYGVLYPLQTFNKDLPIDFSEIPIFINSNSDENTAIIHRIALQLSPKVQAVSNEQRLTMHVAAVLVNNFVNHLFAIGAEVLHQKGLDFEVVKPLIAQTVHKLTISDQHPADLQTGPAKRGDAATINKHLIYLTENLPEYTTLYTLISESIQRFDKK